MHLPFRVRKLLHAAPATGLLLLSEDVAELLALCAELGTGEGSWPPVHAVPGGFLVKLEGAAPQVVPGVMRLRCLAPDLYLPVDAELEPALLEDEAAGLARGRGLVFLPGGRVLGFDPGWPLRASDLVRVTRVPARCWQPLPSPVSRPERLREVLLERAEESPEVILGRGGESVGVEEPRPADSGAVQGLAGRAAAGVGRGLMWLGSVLGWRGLARAGAGMVSRALERVPRLSEELLGRQEAALRELLRRFREGDLEEALRRALPLGGGSQRGGRAAQDDRLPTHNLAYRLADLLGAERGRASIWCVRGNVQAELAAEYRRAAEQAVRCGDYRRAAVIHGRLLHDYRTAADVLSRGGLHHDAAVLYLEKVGDPARAAQAFEAAGEVDRALHLYRQRGEHLLAGDLLRRAGEEEAALQEYLLAAEEMAGRQDHVTAGKVLLTRAGRPDLAREYFALGWARRPQGSALGCLLQLAALCAQEESPRALLALVEEAGTFLDGPGQEQAAGQFYNELARLAEAEHLRVVRDELRDRALCGLAAQLRRRAGAEVRPGSVVSSLLGGTGVWEAALVSDADCAFRSEVRATQARERLRGGRRVVGGVRVGAGVVTAACAASSSGDLFLGFASGAVVCFQPGPGAVIPLPTYPWPVTALATDALGSNLVVFRRFAAGVGHLTSYRRHSDSCYLECTRRRVQVRGQVRLTAVSTQESESMVGLWDGEALSVLLGRELIPQGQVSLPFPAGDFRGAVLPGHIHGQLAWSLAFLFDQDSVWVPNLPLAAEEEVGRYLSAGGTQRAPIYLGWQPGLPAGTTLANPPLSWRQPSMWQLELAGVTAEGGLFWSALELFTKSLMATTISEGKSRYRACALVGSRRVAGVHRHGVEWLRCDGQRCTPWSLTRADLGSTLACFASPRTNELLVVCPEGQVVRVAVPN